VNVAIDYLEIWQAPIGEQIRPRRFPVLTPHWKQRNAVVNFGVLPKASAALAAAPCLQPPQERDVVARRVPKLPCDHAGAVPVRVHVSAAAPQIDMPTEAIDRLAAYTAATRTLRICAFAIGRGWRSICGRQSMVGVIAELSSPAAGRSAPGSKRPRQPIGADWMGAPIRIYREPRRRRHERAAECPGQNGRWKDAWQCTIETRERLTISFCPLRLPFGHLRPPGPDGMMHRSRKAFVTYLRASANPQNRRGTLPRRRSCFRLKLQ
jgi:hypothetical protein